MTEPILEVTGAASEKIKSVMEAEKLTDKAVRVTVRESGAAFRYQLEFVGRDEKGEGDAAVETDGILVYVDAESQPLIQGATLKYIDEVTASGFQFDNPNRPRLLDNPIAEKVQRVLDEHINPGVASHGGNVSLVDVQDSRIYIRMGGGCQGCGMADVTLREGIETMIRESVPEVTEILDATDHDAGNNPYYS